MGRRVDKEEADKYEGNKEPSKCSLKIVVMCSWCQKVMQGEEHLAAKDPLIVITHGICKPCVEKMLKEQGIIKGIDKYA